LKPFVSIKKGDKISADTSEAWPATYGAMGRAVYCIDHGGKQWEEPPFMFWFEVLLSSPPNI
jgi:hypothetical protein